MKKSLYTDRINERESTNLQDFNTGLRDGTPNWNNSRIF